MERAMILVAVAACLVIVGCWMYGGEIAAALDTWRMQVEAKRAQAESELLKAQSEHDKALADLERAQGERELYEAAAESVRKDSRLVAWNAVRRDFWQGVILVLGSITLIGFWVREAWLAVLERGMHKRS